MQKLWTVAEVARHLGLQDIDVEQLVKEGKLIGYKLGGQFIRFRPDQVMALKTELRFRPNTGRVAVKTSEGLYQRIREFIYFYDFYVLSVVLLAVLIVYLIAS